MPTVEVHTRTIGSVKAQGPEHLTLDVLEERLTVAELIQRTVEAGVREEAMRRMKSMPHIQGMLPTKEASERGFLTEEEIAAQRQLGMICLPNQNGSVISIPDAKAQVQKALRAFQVGTYIVLIDKNRVTSLDEEIIFAPTTSIQFIRLTPLVGG